jgi:hypothetical protein
MKRVNIIGHNAIINNLSTILILFGSSENLDIISIIKPTNVPTIKYVNKLIVI